MSSFDDNSQDNLTNHQVKLNEMVSNLNVVDKNGNSVDFEKIIYSVSNANSNNSFATVQSIDELRALEPNAHGEIVVVLAYNAGTNCGGGIFIYDMNDKTTAEDFGLNIVTRGGKRWKRYITDLAGVTVVDFGAIPDGKTDCLTAVTRMWNWTRLLDRATNIRIHENVGIRFPAGNFFISKFDLSHITEVNRFRLSGAHVDFGYFPNTRLFSDQKNGEYMFSVNARLTYISGLIINGQDNTKTKGFFKNALDGGQYLRVSSVHFLNMGGRGLDVLDTLDCKIDQWYASHCSNSVIYGRWSNRAAGSWDHLTAIELSNFNIQSGTKELMIDLPRATQCFIHNGWIEHTEWPGDISNGQWVINGLSLENNTNPMKGHYARIVSTALNVHGRHGIDRSDVGERWLSAYEDGQVYIQNYGVKIEGSLNYQYITSPERMDNRADRETWFKVGEIEIPEWSAVVQMRIIGSAQYLQMPTTQIDHSARTPQGEANIHIQNVNGNLFASWSAVGSCPLTRVALQSTGTGRAEVYVKLARYTGFCIALLTTNSADRYASGVHFRFIKAYTQVTGTEATALDTLSESVFLQHWEGTERVGFGYNANNELLLRGQVINANTTSTATQCLRVMVNGRAYAIDLKPIAG
ncbi:hypothetical protein [Kalamiella sp. sgz302252]|uniref:hypothetical protein n=1 Tax=Pantoea sp. sgz302252 TaxID=3341827 RepID=UPI0036D3496E